jgi:hypothetical protein
LAESKSEKVLKKLHDVLTAGLSGVTVKRNEAVPLKIPAAGLVILRDGDPGEADFIHSPPTWLYEHRAEVEVFVDLASASARDSTFDGIKTKIAEALANNRTLDGLVDYAVGEAPAPLELSAEGAPGIKAAAIIVLLPYDTSDPLA